MLADLPVGLLLALVTVFLCSGLLRNVNLPRGDDVQFHVLWGSGFVESLHEGVLYPRWNRDMSAGFGGPVFVYYSPLSYVFLAFCDLFFEDLFSSFRLCIFLTTLLAGLAFYWSAKPLTNKTAAVIGAAVYILMPYRALDIYQRFAFAETVSFIWLPPILTATIMLGRAWSRRWFLVFAGCYFGLITTHVVSGFTTLLVVPPLILIVALIHRSLASPFRVAAAGLIGCLLASAYLVPLIMERDEIHLEWSQDQAVLQWTNQFLFEYPPVRRGEVPPIKVPISRTGTLVLIILVASAALIVEQFLRERGEAVSSRAPLDAVSIPVIAFLTFFLQTRPSAWLWEHVPMLASVQFPWRFASWHAAAVCLTIALALGWSSETERSSNVVRRPPRRLLARPITRIVIVIVVAAPAVSFAIDLNQARPYNFLPGMAERYRGRGPLSREYLPAALQHWGPVSQLVGLPQVGLQSGASAEVLRWETHEREIVIKSPTGTDAVLKTFNFPGWTARIDGIPTQITSADPIELIGVSVPPGTHNLTVSFEPTTPRKVGLWLSLLGVIVCGSVAFASRRPVTVGKE